MQRHESVALASTTTAVIRRPEDKNQFNKPDAIGHHSQYDPNNPMHADLVISEPSSGGDGEHFVPASSVLIRGQGIIALRDFLNKQYPPGFTIEEGK